ncbi:MAG: hypothetical protein WBG65_06320 [Sulfurimonadaceae bacterium]
MLQANDMLPKNIQDMIPTLSLSQAMPLGSENGVPFLMIKLAAGNEETIAEGGISCEFRASVFNVVFQGENVALCFVQFRLNGSDKHIYTASYDLHNEKHYNDCHDLLEMKKYGLLIVTDNAHDFIEFKPVFKADFQPKAMIHGAKELATDYEPGLFMEVAHAIISQGQTPAELWKFLEQMAPFEKSWYGSMQLGATKI